MAAIDLKGFDEMLRRLNEVDERLTNRASAEMADAAARVVVQRAAELCPVDTGALADSITFLRRHYGKNTVAVIGPARPEGAHGHLVEYGHELRAKGRQRLGGKARPRTASLGRVPPKPFLRPALDETVGQQRAAMEKVIAQALHDLGG